MELLPQEIKAWILLFCDDDSLALSIPRVSKLYNKLSEDDGAIWKRKCSLIKKNENIKLEDQSWKQFYFAEYLILFPLYGFTIGKSTYDEMRVVPQAVEGDQDASRYVTYRRQDFWVGTSTVFNMMYTTRSEPLPTEWTDQGLSWALSWVQLKQILKKKVGNYQASKFGYEEFQGKQCFTGEIGAVLKQSESGVYYQIEFAYNYRPGDENTEGTMYSITIMSSEDDYNTDDFKERYINAVCQDEYSAL